MRRDKVGDSCFGELLTKAFSWHQSWEKGKEAKARDSRFDFRCAGSPFGSWLGCFAGNISVHFCVGLLLIL